MIGNDTIQTLRKIVAEMGRDSVCLNPNSFAGAILDICDADDVKLLTNSLRAYYSGKLMDFFRNGSSDAATWAQQKAFLAEESGMSSENVEIVLDALWQAMDWHPPKTASSSPKPEPEKQPNLKVDPKYKKEYIDTSKAGSSGGTASPQVEKKYKKEYIDTSKANSSGGTASPQVGKKHKK